MTTYDDATARRIEMNVCVKGRMTPIQTLKQMQSTDRYTNVSKQLVADLVMGGQAVIIVDDRHARIESRLWPSRTLLKTVREVAVSVGCSKSTAQRVLTADLGLSYVSTR